MEAGTTQPQETQNDPRGILLNCRVEASCETRDLLAFVLCGHSVVGRSVEAPEVGEQEVEKREERHEWNAPMSWCPGCSCLSLVER